MGVDAFVKHDIGYFKGCWQLTRWNDTWPALIPIYLTLVFGSVAAAGVLTYRGHRAVGFAIVCVAVYLAFLIIGVPQCTDADSAWEMGWYSNWIFLAFVLLCAWFLRAQRDDALKPGGWASALVYRKVATPIAGANEYTYHPKAYLNEIATATWGEVLVWGAIFAWLLVAFVERYDNITADPPTENSGYETWLGGSKARAAGRGFAQMAVRALFLSILSPSRNVALFQLFGIPFDRGVKQHERLGTLFYLFMSAHVLCMIIGGEEKGDTKWSNTLNLNYLGSNLWPGLVAFLAWIGQAIVSQPYFRRRHFETFYWLHINFMFVGNVFVILHNRMHAAMWIIPTFAFFWLDLGVRWYAKLMKKATLTHASMVSDDLCKLVVRREGFPGKAFDFHPGSYIWLSVDVPKEKRQELMKSPLGPPMAPVDIPSFLWFHPITVSSYDPSSGSMTLFVKRMGVGDDEWSGQLIKCVEAIRDGTLPLDALRVHVGGPHGDLQVNPDHVDHCVLACGGIGVTPMAAILEDRARRASETSGKTTLLWTTRAASEIRAFSYLFDQIAAMNDADRARFDVRIFLTAGTKAADVEAGVNAVAKIAEGRPDFDALIAAVAAKEAAGACAVYACGPATMADAAERAAVVNGCLVHRETFEF